MDKKLEGKVAVVTGASKGIGAAIAKALAREGAAVVVNYASSKEAADRVVSEIAGDGGTAVSVQADVAGAEGVARLFSGIDAAYGKIDILVNNAGLYQPEPIGAITEASFHTHFNLNVLGLILASQEAVRRFGPDGGAIINVSSVVSQVTPPGIAVYNATKGAVDSVTRSFARELAGRKIRVNAVNPGLIATEGTHAAGFAPASGEDASPLGAIGRPEDIASLVVFLASDDSRWINGQLHIATGELL